MKNIWILSLTDISNFKAVSQNRQNFLKWYKMKLVKDFPANLSHKSHCFPNMQVSKKRKKLFLISGFCMIHVLFTSE